MKRILFIEDDECLRSLYGEMFEQEGYEVLLAADGIEGLKALETNKVDLVVTDIRMKKMEGPEILSCILSRRKGLPVIIYSAYPKHTVDLMNLAAAVYITKSSNFDELRMKIKELIGD
jgi:DNA-binding response OmpR family regulator